jgi:hypothetical protein
MAQDVIKRSGSWGTRRLLLLVKYLGLTGAVGGLGALSALVAFAPEPQTLEGWVVLRAAMRAIFWPCVFGGLMVTIATGLILLFRQPKVFIGLRWFRVKLVAILVVVPTLHVTARSRVHRFDEALVAERLEELSTRWAETGRIFLVAFVAMLIVGAIGRFKPRFGTPRRPWIGASRVKAG